MNSIQKYLSLAALLAIGCSPSTQQAKVNRPEPVQPNCSSLDLTKKVGFSTSFNYEGEKFCYHISSQGEHYYEAIGNCDAQGRPLPENVIIIREFAGPKVGYMEVKAILAVSGDSMDYISFYREPSGEISTIPLVPVPDNLEQLFQNGARMLDQTKTYAPVCKELLEYPVCKLPEYKPLPK